MKFPKYLIFLEILLSLAGVPALVHARGNGGPSYADTLKWIQGNIKAAGIPSANGNRTQKGPTFVCTSRENDGTCASGYHDPNGYTVTSTDTGTRYSIKTDGCSSLIITASERFKFASTDTGGRSKSDSSWTTTHWRFSFASIDQIAISPQKVQLPENCDMSHPIGSPDPPPCTPEYGWAVYILMQDQSGTYDVSDSFGSHISGQLTVQNSSGLPNGKPGSIIFFGIPGAEGVAPHMMNALKHLVEICKKHPEQAPKSLF